MMFKYLTYCLFFVVISLQSLAEPPDSLVTEKYSNGIIKLKGIYKGGQKHKRWYFFDSTGKMVSKEAWDHGSLKWRAEYDNGKIRRTYDKSGKISSKTECGCN